MTPGTLTRIIYIVSADSLITDVNFLLHDSSMIGPRQNSLNFCQLLRDNKFFL